MNSDDVVPIGLALLVFTGMFIGFDAYHENEAEKLKAVAIETSQKMSEKIAVDIASQNIIELSEGYSIDFTHVNIDSANNILGETQKSLNIYGHVNNESTFKNVYNLSDKQYSELTKKMSAKQAIKKLGEIFETLALSEHSASDIKAVTLGFTEASQLENLAKNIGPAIYKNSIFKKDENKTPDAFIPVYSEFKIVQKDGKYYAQLELQGVDVHERQTLNPAGFAIAGGMYGSGSSFGTSYAVGLAVAITTSIEEHDTYFRTELVRMELGQEHQSLTNDQIRDQLLAQLGSKQNNLEFKTASLSKNLRNNANARYTKMYEDNSMEM